MQTIQYDRKILKENRKTVFTNETWAGERVGVGLMDDVKVLDWVVDWHWLKLHDTSSIIISRYAYSMWWIFSDVCIAVSQDFNASLL